MNTNDRTVTTTTYNIEWLEALFKHPMKIGQEAILSDADLSSYEQNFWLQKRSRQKQPVQQEWVQELTMMQQSVLFSAIRNPDGVAKRHPQKMLMRWYRRCILLSSFERRAITDPTEPGGGSFTGPIDTDIETVIDNFMNARDEMTLHFYAHFMHAAEIIGYKHPVQKIREQWAGIYKRMVHALHMQPESEIEMDKRLGDNEDGWRARNDPTATCSD